MTAALNPVSPATLESLGKVVRTNGQTCAVDRQNEVDTTSSAPTVLLPSQFTNQTIILVSDSGNNAATNPITIATDGTTTIDGVDSITLNYSGGCVALGRDPSRNCWTRLVLSRELEATPSRARIIQARDLPRQTGGLPQYYQIDASDQMVYRFNGTLGNATITNLGALGSALNLAISSATNVQQGIGDGYFGKGLAAAVASNVSYAVRTGVHDASAWTALTCTAWVTFNRYVGAANFGRVFFKNANVGLWSSPFANFSLQFESLDGDLAGIIQNNVGGSVKAIAPKQKSGVMLNRTMLLGMTYSNADRTVRVYVNGEEVASTVGAGGFAMALNSGQWQFGDTFAGNIENPGGIFHELRVCDVQRSQAWMRAVYNAGIGAG